MKKLKQIAALVGAVLLLGMYVLAFIFSLSHSPNAGNMLLAAIYCTVLVPVFLYACLLVYRYTRQKNGIPLGADEIYKETWLWLKERNCEKLVNPRLIEAYAQAFARYIQCEEATSTYGLLGKHPTTGGVITSPFVQMSQQYQKSANLIWYEIYDIVKQNCTEVFEDNPNDTMELLLRARRK